jgi:hypothetical protein
MSYAQLLRPEVLVFLVGGLVAIVYVAVSAVSHVLTHRDEVRLKTRLLERGFSAEEIERVVRASSRPASEQDDPPP